MSLREIARRTGVNRKTVTRYEREYEALVQADPEEGAAFVYMHDLLPDDERYCHPRVRAAAYGMIE